jgi:hypothetical protein
MKSLGKKASEFKDFKKRCRNDVFLKQSIRQARDRVVIEIADTLGYQITLRQLRKQRKLIKRRQKYSARRGFQFRKILKRLVSPFRSLYPN